MTTTPELPEPRNIGNELAEALGLDPQHVNSITIEPAGGGDLVVNVTSTMYLHGWDTDGEQRADALIDRIKQYRLVPITDNDVHPLR